jgi:hypothetical protein
MVVLTASATDGKEQIAADTASGSGYRRSVTSVMMPSVPSLPTNSRVRSYPADDLRARVPVRTASPPAVTTSSDSTFSRIVP